MSVGGEGEWEWLFGGKPGRYQVGQQLPPQGTWVRFSTNDLRAAQNAMQNFNRLNAMSMQNKAWVNSSIAPTETPFLGKLPKIAKPTNWVRKCSHCGRTATEKNCEGCGAPA